jgi:hypothetical protein
VADVTRRTQIDEALAEADAHLCAAIPGPAVRELRVRLGMLTRVVRGWVNVAPHDAQVAAMLECALDLLAMVQRACPLAEAAPPSRRSSRPASRPQSLRPAHARTTRPAPRREASLRTTRPPPRRAPDGPPSSRKA